jgi:hypothetical protein
MEYVLKNLICLTNRRRCMHAFNLHICKQLHTYSLFNNTNCCLLYELVDLINQLHQLCGFYVRDTSS